MGEGTLRVGLFGELARLDAHIPSLGTFANATVATAAPFDYRAVAVVNALDLARLTPLLGAVPGQLAGQVDATAAASGAFGGDAPPQVQANLQRMDAQVGGVPVALVAPAAIAWQPGELTVRHFTASLGDGTLTAEGTRGGSFEQCLLELVSRRDCRARGRGPRIRRRNRAGAARVDGG